MIVLVILFLIIVLFSDLFVEQYFDFELMHCPASLFKNDLMRKPDKASLRNVFLTDKATVNPGIIVGQHVLDGGNLLYRVHWKKGMKFNEIAETYVSMLDMLGKTMVMHIWFLMVMMTKYQQNQMHMQ